MKLQSASLFVAAVACSLMIFKPPVVVRASEVMKKLHEHLLNNYDVHVRPVLDEQSSVVVNLTAALNNLLNLNMQDQVLATSGYLDMVWFDEYLKWNPDHFANITTVYLPQSRVWLPDIVIFNDVNSVQSLRQADTLVVVQYDGAVFWQPSFNTNTQCTIDVYRYPLDTQTCSLVFTSWVTTSQYLQIFTQYFYTNWTSVNQEYTIVTSEANRFSSYPSYSNEAIEGGNFTLVIKRRFRVHLAATAVPLLAFSVLSPLTFLVPDSAGDKTTLAVTVLLTHVVFHGALRDSMPSSGDSVSLLVLFTEIQIILAFLAVVINALVLYIPSQSKGTALDTSPRPTGHNGYPSRNIVRMFRKRSMVTPAVSGHPAAASSANGASESDDVKARKDDSSSRLRIPPAASNTLLDTDQHLTIKSSSRSRDKLLFLMSLFVVLMVDIVFGVLLVF